MKKKRNTRRILKPKREYGKSKCEENPEHQKVYTKRSIRKIQSREKNIKNRNTREMLSLKEHMKKQI